MKRSSLVTLGLVGAVLMTTAACGSANGEDPPKPAVRVNEALTIDASAETKTDLGVVIWGAASDEHGTTFIHGYDADSRRVIELMIADDSSNADFGRNFLLRSRSSTAPVSRNATCGWAWGFSGPWTVTR